MNIYKRLLKYSFKYKYRLTSGIVLSFFVSVLNGASLTSLIPIFDSLGTGEKTNFEISLTKKDKALLQRLQEKDSFSRTESIELRLAEWKIRLNSSLKNMSHDQLVLLFCFVVFPVYLLKLTFLAAAIYCINSAGYLAIRDLRAELYAKAQTLPLNHFVQEKTGILMSRIINDVEVLGRLISSDLKDAIIDFFYIVTHLLLLLYLSWKMFLAVFIVVPIVMGPVSAFADKIRRATRNQQERLSSLNGHLQEVISGIRVIRAFSMEKAEAKRFWEFNQDLSDKTFKGHFYHQVGPSLTELFSSIVAVVFLSFGAYLMEDGTFSRGMFMAFFLTLIFLMRPFKQMSMLSNSIQSAISAGSRVFELLDQETDIQNPVSPKFLKKMEKGLSFNNVTFTYPGAKTPAIQEINLEIPKGETVALVGASGAGKSTLVDLIPRLIDPQEGQIFIDGIDIRELDLSNLRKRIGIVAQQVFLFNGTIRENICYGNQSVTEEQLRSVCEQAFAMEFILSFEEGFDTIVGERGVMLSGGQRQRIAIARALLLNPEILILDEATSALDTESERLVQQALESLYKNRTVIIIAHRLSTVQIANTIFAMEDGRIVESGTHAELIRLDGKYKKLYDIQFVEFSESV
ncbi:ABC transporter ATP-binding protein [Leptospira borgpetersenii]|uniref:ABC transporter transmembrane region n=1 Tax=Leptospira borgpetersenii serovar Ballum TaxID=280505 RepID=A0A0E3BAT6_LEPBO|nr:ABC transporter ATP-binding protein [Leptospira borgpetersenii]EMO11456.1 ABC transporter transmembrane region [Leptospira borgpetersenii str. Noumea 25]ALO27764.1 ABC transporter transmembrane region [Leptospira borgpetersenii serovar Ballum]ANH02003.1 ABC transporter transmembrane region [Leptospira borgpetersenii str. 4E]EKQ99674.1 ABC transporter transmembrane region [Leptospira borgpetersenii serovar Castellonis str. 200801910]KGE25914.1 ABC transporter permease [Leptospira borgpeterse